MMRIGLPKRRLFVFSGLVGFRSAMPAACWAQSFSSQIPQPPATPLIPDAGAIYYAYFNWLLAALVLAYMLRESWRTRSMFPLAFSAAGAIGVFAEPIYDSNMHVWFARPDTLLFQSYNITYPWYGLIGESMMAGPIYWMYQQFQHGVTTRALWGYFAVWWIFQALLEIPGNLTNAYIYYGPHPFRVLGFPMWLGLCLSFGIPLAGYMMHKLRGVLAGPLLWVMTVIMVPVTLFGSQLIGWPMWVTLNGGGGLVATHIAALISLAFSLAGYHGLALVYAKERADSSRAPGAGN